LSLLTLTVISICIAVLTYFFFHSFQEHRRVLEKRWFARGQQSLAAGNPRYAVEDFRSALSLSAANPRYELALAEALAAANRNEEAYAYFSSLHDTQPGDGFLNLQLARLAVKRDDPTQAINFYQSALTGLWYGQGTAQRFQIRLELAKYLMSLGKNDDAQGDLLAAEGNSLDNPAELFQVAALLEQAGDPADAWTAYRRVELHSAATPSQVLKSLQAEANVSVAMGQYKRAAEALVRYNAKAKQHPGASSSDEKRAVSQQLDQLQRLLLLIPFNALPPRQHAERILIGASIAHKRYSDCMAHIQPQNVSGDNAATLSALGTQWMQLGPLDPDTLAGNVPLQQTLLAWINQTEILTAELCGAPTGDDALLLQLGQTPDKSE
jgi:tetratricopeptide (TPR) repeat protein